MNLPCLKILVIEDDPELLSDITQNLDRVIERFERNDITIEILEAASVLTALKQLENDGDIQAIVLSWDVTGEWEMDPEKKGVIRHNVEILEAIKRRRIELPVYVLGDASEGLNVVDDSNEIEAFFFRDEMIQDPEAILGYILNDFDDRCQTPFWTAYKKYVTENNDSWHTPGHSGGSSFRNSPYIQDFYQFFGRNVFVSDLSVSVDSLGSLTEGTHAIGKAQAAAAYTFEVAHTFFVTNGSSTSNKMILQTLLRQGDKVIVDRNCHKSVHYGLIQARAEPQYLDSVFNTAYGIFAPPTLSEIREALENTPEAKLIVLTGCTYDGMLMDLKQVVEMAHERGVKVFIDEAWFAYALFHPRFRPYSAIQAGADYVTHSAHKVVSAFSQASYIHVNDPDFDADFFHEIYSIYSSTSPKYQLIASLDVCHKQLEMEGYGLIHKLLGHVDELKARVKELKNIRILDDQDFAAAFPHYVTDNMGHDPLKILIDVSGLESSTTDIHRYLLDEIGLEVEKFTHSTLLVLLTLGGTHSKVIRLYNALKKLDLQRVSLPRTRSRRKLPNAIPGIDLKCLPADAFFGKRDSILLDHSVGRVAAGLVTPYPPGIPLLIPGQLIQQAHLDYLKVLMAQNLNIQGCYDGEIYVKADT